MEHVGNIWTYQQSNDILAFVLLLKECASIHVFIVPRHHLRARWRLVFDELTSLLGGRVGGYRNNVLTNKFNSAFLTYLTLIAHTYLAHRLHAHVSKHNEALS